MRKLSYLSLLALLSVSSFVITMLESCTKDNCEEVYTYTVLKPVYQTYGEFREGAGTALGVRNVENIGKVINKSEYLFMVERNQGVHVIYIGDPNVINKIGFLNIPGAKDLCIRGNTLFADSFTDLVTFNIGDPFNCQYLTRVENVFPARDYSFIPDYKLEEPLDPTLGVILDLEEVERVAVLPCDSTPHPADENWDPWEVDTWLNQLAAFTGEDNWDPSMLSGSSEKFTIIDEYLFAIDGGYLTSYRIINPLNISKVDSSFVDWGLKSLLPYERQNKDYLLAGTGSNTFFYEVLNGYSLFSQGKTRSFTGCDNVVADQSRAYVTSRDNTSTSSCPGATSLLQIFNIDTLQSPQPVSSYDMEEPLGLGIDEDLLFVCDRNSGLHLFDVESAIALEQNLQKNLESVIGSDILLYEINGRKIALVIAEDGLFQYDYTVVNDIQLLDRLLVEG